MLEHAAYHRELRECLLLFRVLSRDCTINGLSRLLPCRHSFRISVQRRQYVGEQREQLIIAVKLRAAAIARPRVAQDRLRSLESSCLQVLACKRERRLDLETAVTESLAGRYDIPQFVDFSRYIDDSGIGQPRLQDCGALAADLGLLERGFEVRDRCLDVAGR